MWSWIEQLKEPIISKDDIDMLAKNSIESQDALNLLKKVDVLYVNALFEHVLLLYSFVTFKHGN